MNKICKICGIEKDISLFQRNPGCKDGVAGKCKDCHNKAHREERKKNIDREREYRKRSYLKNKEYYAKKNKDFMKRHPNYYKDNYEKNSEKICESQKRYREKNIDKCRATSNEYAKNNREKINKRRRIKAEGSSRYKLQNCMRKAISCSLKRRLSKKNGKTFESLGYSVDELMKHLESKFQIGMTWDNYGEWHIDHIIPDSWFDYSVESDHSFKESWSLNNLQPKWAKENRIKGNRYIG